MVKPDNQHPVDSLLHQDKIPSIWCSGCGIGIVVNTFLQAVKKLNVSSDNIRILSSGLSCSGLIPEYLSVNQVNIPAGEAIPTAKTIREENPDNYVIALLNDTDFMASGASVLKQDYADELKLLVIYINGFLYNLFIGHKDLKRTPFVKAQGTGNVASPFNLPDHANQSGASFIARWTPLHVRRLYFSIKKALNKPGLSFVEIISPCLMYYASEGNLGKTIDRMGRYLERSVIKNQEPTENLDLRDQQEIILGTFIDR